MRGGRVGFLAVFHVGTVTQLAQPLLVGLAALGLAQLGTGRIAQPLGRFGVGSPAQHLHQVHAELGLHRFADLAVMQGFHGLLEFGHVSPG